MDLTSEQKRDLSEHESLNSDEIRLMKPNVLRALHQMYSICGRMSRFVEKIISKSVLCDTP